MGRFASVDGWTLGRKAPTDLYAGTALISLTAEQQARVEEVAYGVYRPCCNNHTAFADCNHGMAVGREVFSGADFRQVHRRLVANEALPQPSGGGNSCGV